MDGNATQREGKTMDINESQIRAGVRHESTKPFAVCNIASKVWDSGSPFMASTVSDVIIYGKGNRRTVAVRTRSGRKLSFETLGKVNADANGYADAAEMIETWLGA